MRRRGIFAAAALLAVPAWAEGVFSASEALRLGAEAERGGAPARAVRFYGAGLEAAPGDPALEAALRRSARALGEKASRANATRRVAYVRVARDRRRADAARRTELSRRCAEGRRALRRGDALEAADVFRRALEERSDFAPAAAGLRRAAALLERRRERGRFASARHAAANEGLRLYLRGEWEGSARFLDEALAGGDLPDDLRRARLGDYAADAARRARGASRRRERDAAVEKAAADYRAGRLAEARAALEAEQERDPSDGEVRAWLETLRRVEGGARAAAERESARREAAERMTRGTLAYVQGRHADALEDFARALELDPERAEAREMLEEVRMAMKREGLFVPPVPTEDEAERLYREGLRHFGDGRQAEAAAAFENALSLRPGHEGARAARERLAAGGSGAP